MTKYLSVAEFRDFTNLQDSEYSDTQLASIINSAESWFDDEVKGNTLWNHPAVTEYRKGNGTNEIFTKKFPIQTFTSLGVDDEDDGTYTDIDLNVDANYNTDTGHIVLHSDADIPLFYKYSNKNTVKIVYTPGFAETPEFVKFIIVKMVGNILNKLPIDNNVEKDLDKLKDFGINMSL